MTKQEYQEQFRKNLLVMSNTARGIVDVSASRTKSDSMVTTDGEKAKALALSNTKKAVEFLYDNRTRNFSSPAELEGFLLEVARITNDGIVKPESLFRNGEDCAKFPYVRIKDIPEIWDWFVKTLFWMLRTSYFEVEETAAFCEYIINMTGHFFSDGCGKIAMLIGMYIFMRKDIACARYPDRTLYYRIANNGPVLTPKTIRRVFTDEAADNFMSFYKSICPVRQMELKIYCDRPDENTLAVYLSGYVNKENVSVFEREIRTIFDENAGKKMILDGKKLFGICTRATDVLADLISQGKSFSFRHAGYDCSAAFAMSRLDSVLGQSVTLPEMDFSGCAVLGEGANSVVYRVNGEVIAKVFKNRPPYDSIMQERLALKNALIAGVPAPFSLGYALNNGRIVILMELIDSKPLLDRLRQEDSSSSFEETMKAYVCMVKSMHETRSPQILGLFTRNDFERELLRKADRVDPFLREPYRGKARRIIEALDEPEGLIHGDIQPKNVMFSGNEMIFIDFDTFCTGKGILDLAAFYRTLFTNSGLLEGGCNSFLELSEKQCNKVWDAFFEEYYRDLTNKEKQAKFFTIRALAFILAAAKEVKRNPDAKITETMIKKVERYLESV